MINKNVKYGCKYSPSTIKFKQFSILMILPFSHFLRGATVKDRAR